MKLRDWLSGVAVVNSVIAFLNEPLPAQLQLSLDLHESGKWVAALLTLVAVAVSLAYAKVLRAKGATGAKLVGWALACGLLSFIATQGYIYLVEAVPEPGLLWDRTQTALWSIMFAAATACFVFVVQAIAAAGAANSARKGEVEGEEKVEEEGPGAEGRERNTSRVQDASMGNDSLSV